MALRYLFSELQEDLFGCDNKSYKIQNVDVMTTTRIFYIIPQYLVIAKCNKCECDCSHIINNHQIDDQRVVNAAKWLYLHNKKWAP